MDRVDAIYISHLHSDHFDPVFLKGFGLLDKTFIIHEFTTKVLRTRLQKLGARKIIEVTPFALIQFGDVRLTTISQLTSNSANLADDVNYNLEFVSDRNGLWGHVF